jgi:hypothetical protein
MDGHRTIQAEPTDSVTSRSRRLGVGGKSEDSTPYGG